MAADEDRVIAEFDVYITPKKAEELYLLQYPNRERDRPYNERHRTQPVEIRIKPNAGFLEVDVPIVLGPAFDKTKGVQWGEALRRAKEEGQTGFGMPAGFERAPIPRSATRSAAGNAAEPAYEVNERLVANFDEANEQGRVLNKQTLGGEIMRGDAEDKPMYMLGAFTQNQLHLTKLDGIVAMRPQFHHLDANSYIEQANRRREASENAKAAEPRAVQMSLKATDGLNQEPETLREMLRKAKEDTWVKLEYHDEEAEEAYRLYGERVFVGDTEAAPKLSASLSNEEYLEAVSVQRVDPGTQTKKKAMTKKELIALDDSDASDHTEAPEPREAPEKRVRFQDSTKVPNDAMEINN